MRTVHGLFLTKIGKRTDGSKTESGTVRYFPAENFITWTGYSGYDPEVSQSESATQMGIDWGTYPNVRTVVVGLNLTF